MGVSCAWGDVCCLWSCVVELLVSLVMHAAACSLSCTFQQQCFEGQVKVFMVVFLHQYYAVPAHSVVLGQFGMVMRCCTHASTAV